MLYFQDKNGNSIKENDAVHVDDGHYDYIGVVTNVEGRYQVCYLDFGDDRSGEDMWLDSFKKSQREIVARDSDCWSTVFNGQHGHITESCSFSAMGGEINWTLHREATINDVVDNDRRITDRKTFTSNSPLKGPIDMFTAEKLSKDLDAFVSLNKKLKSK